MTLICDTSGLLAALDTNEARHRPDCAATLLENKHLVVSPLVLAELDYLVCKRVGLHALNGFYSDIEAGVYEIPALGASAITDARRVDVQYSDMAIGLTDAVNVVLAREYDTNRILSLDAHYRAIKPLTRHQSFSLSPTDD